MGFCRHADTKGQVEGSDELRQQLRQKDSDLTPHATLGKGRHGLFETFLPVHGNDAHVVLRASVGIKPRLPLLLLLITPGIVPVV